MIDSTLILCSVSGSWIRTARASSSDYHVITHMAGRPAASKEKSSPKMSAEKEAGGASTALKELVASNTSVEEAQKAKTSEVVTQTSAPAKGKGNGNLLEESKQRSKDVIAGARSLLIVTVLGLACIVAFSSRLFAVIRFESIIHEFDPW